MEAATSPATQHQFPCKNCGANLVFEPGTTSLKCPYCGALNDIPKSAAVVEEQDYEAQLRDCCKPEDMAEVLTVRCTTCGAETSLGANVTASRCPFCGSAIVAQ